MWLTNVIAGQPQVAIPAVAGDAGQPEAGSGGDFAALLRQLFAALAAGNRGVLPPAAQIWAAGTGDGGSVNGPHAPETRTTPEMEAGSLELEAGTRGNLLAQVTDPNPLPLTLPSSPFTSAALMALVSDLQAVGELGEGVFALVRQLLLPVQIPPAGGSTGGKGEAAGADILSDPGGGGGRQETVLATGQPVPVPVPGTGESNQAASPAVGQNPGALEQGTSGLGEPLQAATRVLSSPAVRLGPPASSGENAATTTAPVPAYGPEEGGQPARPTGEVQPARATGEAQPVPVRSGPMAQPPPTAITGTQAGSSKVTTAVTSGSTPGSDGERPPARPVSSAQPSQAVVEGPKADPPADTATRSPIAVRAPVTSGPAQGYLLGRVQGAAGGPHEPANLPAGQPVPVRSGPMAQPPPTAPTARIAPGAAGPQQPAPLPAGDYSGPAAALERTKRPESNMATGESTGIWQQPAKAAMLPTSTGPALAQQMAEVLLAKSHLWQVPGRAKLEIQLEPKFLGRVEIQLIAEGGKLAAHLLVQSHQVRQLLEANLLQLHHNLQQQGLHLDHLSVDVDTGQGNSAYWGQPQWANSHQGGGQQRSWYPAAPPDDFSGPVLAEQPAARPAAGALDYLV